MAGKSHHDHSHAASHPHDGGGCGHASKSAKDDGNRVKDPVCGMTVDPHKTQHRAEQAGRTYYFCAAGCRAKFAANPERYLSPEEAHAAPVEPGAIYTCPLHPEVRQVGPGPCPICGMALEPVDVTAEHGPHTELLDMQRRFWIAVALSVHVLVLEMWGDLGFNGVTTNVMAGVGLAIAGLLPALVGSWAEAPSSEPRHGV